jgi:biotin synthase
MGKNHFSVESQWRKDTNTILSEVETLVKQGINDLFLMTTEDYPLEEFMEIAARVRKILPQHIKFVANIGDFEYDTARQLKGIGFTGVYHVHRLREGIDTTIQPEIRIRSLDSVRKAGLELYYCVEPIGPEHSYEELATEMLRAREYDVKVMAVMKRIPVKGTPLYDKGQISALELTKIAAVARIVSRPNRAMNAHEVTPITLIGGVNQLYAEFGANPRDNISNTEKGRGHSVMNVKKLLLDAEFKVEEVVK